MSREHLGSAEEGGEGDLPEKWVTAVMQKNSKLLIEICKQCSEAEALSFLKFVEEVAGDEMETVVFALFELAKRAMPNLTTDIEKTVHRFMCYGQNRFVRKAALSALRVLKTGTVWEDYFTLVDILEEPQFHLVEPALPYFDRILNICKTYSSDDGSLPWYWVQLLFVKSLNHPNGWIRVWAIEKVLSVDAALLKTDYSLILSSILAALSNNDIYWRLIENAKLNAFVENFGSFLERIASAGSRSEEKIFFGVFVQLLSEHVSSCTSLFFISCSLQYCEPAPIFTNCSSLYRMLMSALSRMPYIPLRICTVANYMKFFFKLADRSWYEAYCFASLLSDLPEEKYRFLLQEFFYNTTFTETLAEGMIEELEELQSSYMRYCQQQKNWLTYALYTWKLALDHGRAYKLAMGVSYSILSIESGAPDCDFEKADIILQLYTVISDDKLFEREECQYFEYAVDFYLETRLFADTDEVFDPALFNALHKKLLSKHGTNTEQWLLRSMQICNKTASLSTRAALSSVAVAVSTRCHTLSWTMRDAVLEFLLAEESDSTESGNVTRNQSIVLRETITRNKSMLWQRFIAEHSFDSLYVLNFCISSLKIFFSWDCRRALLNLLFAVLKKAATDSMIKESIEAVMVVASEEKKSRNYIPVIEDILAICTLEYAPHMQEVTIFKLQVVEKFYAESEQNMQIAVILSDALYNARESLTTTWFPFLVKMCIFGPVCKRNVKILNAAMQMAYTMEKSLPASNYEKLHECAQYSRLRSLQTVSWICKNRSGSADQFILEAFRITKILDGTKNKSFGLSLAHRQKTRLVQLLLLIYGFAKEVVDVIEIKGQRTGFERIKLTLIRLIYFLILVRWFILVCRSKYCGLLQYIQEVLAELELFCTECLKDITQQPSVRLIVDWILVRLYSSNESALQKFISIEKEFAATRVGSICSWITILMHVTKIHQTDLAFARCFTLFLPWCTAQNFTIRCTALASLKLLWNIAGSDLHEKFDYVRTVVEFDSEKAGNTKRIIDNLCNDFYFAHLNEDADYSLETILTTVPEKTGLTDQDVITTGLLEGISAEDFPCAIFNSNELNKYSSFAFDQTRQPKQQHFRTMKPDVQDASVMQRKYNAVNQMCPEGVSLIVVASLLEKAANLGGICRTCEVLGVEKLIVADLSKVKDRNFTALSVSSENWINLEQVRPQELPSLLRSFHDSGYVIVGAEQTTKSTPLHKIRLPPKMVLLLGNEKGGIPLDLLGYVDKTVEVLQIGRTRSLNVHVAGALFIYRFFEDFIAPKA